MSQEESTLQADEKIRHQGWVIEFDPELEVAFNDDEVLDFELDM